ncbi:MAG: ribonuclease R [Candidatus Sumerlaeota bacterium]|nr:ribonuclease R [Candidatus Sumerlaeota bacterium]
MKPTRDQILDVFQSHPGTAFRLSQIIQQAAVGKHGRSELLKMLNDLRHEGRIILTHDKRYTLASRGAQQTGGGGGPSPSEIYGRQTRSTKDSTKYPSKQDAKDRPRGLESGKRLAVSGRQRRLEDFRAAGEIIGRLSVHERGFGFVRRESAKESRTQIEKEPDEDFQREEKNQSAPLKPYPLRPLSENEEEKDEDIGRKRTAIPLLPDLYISPRMMGDALHGDLVAARTLDKSDPRRPEGRVVQVLERGIKQVVGRFVRSGKRGGIVFPRDQRLSRNVHIDHPPHAVELPDGAWVTTRILEFPPAPHDLVGEIIEVLGDEATRGIDILAVLRDRGIEMDFPEAVKSETARLPEDPSPSEIAGREDFRGRVAFTVDPPGAKDFDDALSVEPLSKGGWRLFVHIADVAHYVQPGSALDAEAMRRSTSIYPVDRVVPMLPEALSGGLCSLKPERDRLTMTVEMEISPLGHVTRHRLCNSVIHSRYRITYQELQAFYDGHDDPGARRLSAIEPDLQELLRLMRVLRERRFERGALDLDLPETEVEFDEAGAVKNIYRAPRYDSHRIIEECMILANESVAAFMRDAGVGILYRVHDQPLREDIARLAVVLAARGIRISLKSGARLSYQIQEALKATEGFEAAPIFNRVILRALTEARYDHRNTGHFGLASRAYTHFTSPIRRYPDLLTHRALKKVLAAPDGKPSGKWIHEWEEALPALGAQCSDLEREAAGIENEATRICTLDFMRRYVGESFQGHIAGVAPFGLFIELRRWPVEGLLHVRDLSSDLFDFDPATLCLRGRRTKHLYHIGQRLEVIVQKVDVQRQEMQLLLDMPTRRRLHR